MIGKAEALATARALVAYGESIQSSPPPADADWTPCPGNPISRVKPVYRNAVATEAAPYQTYPVGPGTMVPVPWRAFSHAVMGRDGKLYYFGGADGDYPSNEFDVFDTATQQWRTPVDRPHLPPEVPPYNGNQGSGGGYAVWTPVIRNPALWGWDGTTGDAGWEMGTIHDYCRVSWLPGLGFVAYAGVWTPPGMYSADGKIFCLCSWNETRVGGKWALHDPEHWNSATQQLLSTSSLSEYDETIDGLYGFGTTGADLYVKRFRLSTMLWESVATYPMFVVGTNGGCHNVYLEGGKHLILRIGQASPNTMFTWRLGSAPVEVPIPSEFAGYVGPPNSAARLYAAADRTRRKVYFGYTTFVPSGTGPLSLACASFDDLGTWAPVVAANAPTINGQSGPSDRAPLHIHGDSLYTLFRGVGGGWPQTSAITLSRLKVA